MSRRPLVLEEVDPFDLPEELGTSEVTWRATDGLTGGPLGEHHVRGVLRPEDGDDVACDLLAVDEAFPAPVVDDETRARTHQAWRHGQVHLAASDGRLTLLVPGSVLGADLVLETVGRLAKALGAPAASYAVHLRLGGWVAPAGTGRPLPHE